MPDESIAAFLRRLRQHSALSVREERALARLRPRLTRAAPNTDLVRQGDKPDTSIFLMSGMLARYHTIAGGDRQYLALHIAGDLPDLQSLFLGVMDHSLVALDHVQLAWFGHKDLCRVMADEPQIAFALWRQTLIDAAIFREAITNNGLRKPVERLAHIFCEQFLRAQNAGIAKENTCRFPLTQTQLGQLLSMSLVSVSRALQKLRKDRSIELRDGQITVRDFDKLMARAEFDPTYLHLDLRSPTGRRSESRARRRG